MIKLLAKFFIEDYKDLENPRVQSQYISLSGSLGLVLNIFLFIIKYMVGTLTNSLALVSDSFNNLSDSLTSVVALVGSVASRKPADTEHPQGHGRLEYVASLIVGILIMFMGFNLFVEAIKEITNPSESILSLAFILVLLVSNLIKVYMYYYNKRLSVDLDSSLNEGVARDSMSDTIATTGILIAGIVEYFTGLHLDGIAGMIISILVFLTGLDFVRDTISALLGERVSEEIENDIVTEILKGDLIKGYHDLYIHDYGRGNAIAHAHVEVPSDISVGEMSKVINDIESSVKAKYGILLVLHMDPRYEQSSFQPSDMTEILDLKSSANRDSAIEKAAKEIQAGGLVVVPTETVYGLAGDGLNEEAIDKIYKAKERSKKNPLILHIGDIKWLDKLAVDIPREAYDLAEKFWPGPLTMVLKKSDLVPDALTAGTDTIGIRMPDNRTFLDLANKVDRPLACPSANISGRPSPTTIIDAYEDMNSKVRIILDEGPSKLGLESTIVDLTGSPRVLRPGSYKMEDLKKTIANLTYEALANKAYKNAQDLAHYKTRAEVYLYDEDLKDQVGKMAKDAKKFMDEGKTIGVLASYEDYHKIPGAYIFNYGYKNDKEEISRILFSKLRDFDRLNIDLILVQGIDKEGLGLGIMNRLEKTAEANVIK